jgi:uncharacterized protein
MPPVSPQAERLLKGWLQCAPNREVARYRSEVTVDGIQRSVIVISKAPRAGFVKTRMCPPLTHGQAAQLATAALADTFAAAAAATADRRVAVFEGDPNGVVPPGWEVVPQRTGGLDVRLADAFEDVLDTGATQSAGCAVLIAMDTPQVSSQQLEDAFAALTTHDAVIGMTDDGGYWIIGLNEPCRKVFEGVPMSQSTTGQAQLDRLTGLGLTVAVTDSLRDLDTVADVAIVAEAFPGLQLSAWWRSVQ